MLYRLLPEGLSEIKERSDAISDRPDNASLIWILNFYAILELILKVIHCCKQITDKSHLSEVRFIGFGYQILDLRIIESILAYHYFLGIQKHFLYINIR